MFTHGSGIVSCAHFSVRKVAWRVGKFTPGAYLGGCFGGPGPLGSQKGCQKRKKKGKGKRQRERGGGGREVGREIKKKEEKKGKRKKKRKKERKKKESHHYD